MPSGWCNTSPRQHHQTVMTISLRPVLAMVIVAWLEVLAMPARAATTPQLSASPSSGPGGTTVAVIGTGFCPTPCSPVDIEFGGRPAKLGVVVGADGAFRTTISVPSTASGGVNVIYASQTNAAGQLQQANTRFTVTPSQPAPGTSTSPARTSAAPKTSAPKTSASSAAPPRSTSPAQTGTPSVTATTSAPTTTVAAPSGSSQPDGAPSATNTPESTGRGAGKGHGGLWAGALAVAAVLAAAGALALRRWEARRGGRARPR